MENVFCVGDIVTAKEMVKGYYRVDKCVLVNRIDQQANKRELVTILLLKKLLNDKFECKNLCFHSMHPFWCKKVDDETAEKIKAFFANNPKEQEKVDAFDKPEKTVIIIPVVCSDNQIVELEGIINELKLTGIASHEEVLAMPFFEKNLYKRGAKNEGQIYDIVFSNFNQETNSNNELIFRPEKYETAKW